MNVEVEVVREVRTTYLVQGVRSLEGAERKALACDGAKKKTGCKKLGMSRTSEPYVQWSQPVIVRNGKVIRGD